MIMNDYFSIDGLEYNMGRIPIGGSDFSTRGYSLDDNNDQEDKELEHFALEMEDLEYKVIRLIYIVWMKCMVLALMFSLWPT